MTQSIVFFKISQGSPMLTSSLLMYFISFATVKQIEGNYKQQVKNK